jgi:hypothetical protein
MLSVAMGGKVGPLSNYLTPGVVRDVLHVIVYRIAYEYLIKSEQPETLVVLG